ncbi:hypothetical protein LBMAG47_13510 [Planctomycetia bacterium]|nr:hypothetical protein LBMAG47_13510 [Planctomycetia bacterium]
MARPQVFLSRSGRCRTQAAEAGTGGPGDGLRRGEKIARAAGLERRFRVATFRRSGKSPPDSQTALPEAHEWLICPETVADVPLAGLSVAGARRRHWAGKPHVATGTHLHSRSNAARQR